MKRKDRLNSFKNSSTGPMTSPEIINCALVLLSHASLEKENTLNTENNHYSRLAISITILATTAFEAWLNEVITAIEFSTFESIAIKDIAEDDLVHKYTKIMHLASYQLTSTEKDELEILSLLRNEVIHYYPRELDKLEYMDRLREKGLSMPNFLGDNGLNNYATAYFVCKTVQDLSSLLTKELGSLKSSMLNQFTDTSQNFTLPKGIFSPLYDK